MNNSYITIIKEKRTALSRKRIPLNQNGCTANFRIGVPFEQNLQALLGPQVGYQLGRAKEICEPKGVPVDVIPMQDYGMCNGMNVLKFAYKLAKNK